MAGISPRHNSYLQIEQSKCKQKQQRKQRASARKNGNKNTDDSFFHDTISLYYRVVVFKAPLQGLCYTVRDAVDWFVSPTARRFMKGSNHSPLQYC